MKVGNWFRACEWVEVNLGQGGLLRYVVFECKYVGGIYFNVWNTIAQDRFHTHAFPSLAILVKGNYFSERFCRGVKYYQAPCIRFISRTNNHRILKSSRNAMSITLTGPWDRMWSETFLDGTKRVLSWGKKVEVDRQSEVV